MVDRRTYLATAGTALTAATAGCGFILGSEPARFSAEPSVVADGALDGTGYEFKGHDEMEIEREFSAAGQTRTVIVTNVLAQYEKTMDLGPLGEQKAGVFTSLTTPKVEILDRTFNPIKDWTAEKLARLVQDRYEDLKNLRKRDESTVTINGNETTQVRFTADATLNGNPVEIALHVSEAASLGSDFVVTFGSYPQQTSGERENILQLMQGVQQE